MKYDPVKNKIGAFVNRSLILRKLFYNLLDILLLRTWHVKKALRKFNLEKHGNADILDAGSGFGQYSWRMSQMNNSWKIDAVDIKQEQVDDCNSFFSKAGLSERVNFSFADLTTFKTKEGYDMILSVDVMEHIEDDLQVFNNFHHSLRQNGWLIISTPSDKGGSDVHDDDDHSFIEEHVRDGYSVDEITEKLESAGFNQLNVNYTYGTPGKVSWKLSMKIPILLLNLSWFFGIILPFWYILVMPFCLLLNYIDTKGKHNEGTGLIVIAIK